MNNIIKKILLMSLYKTLKLNIKYFGLKGLLFPVLIGKNVEIKTLKGKIILNEFKPFNIRIGTNELGNQPKNKYSIFSNTGTIIFNGSASMGIGTILSNSGTLTIGDNFIITADSSILCKKEITFGDNCLLSWNCQIMDTDFHKIYDKDTNEIINPDMPIKIGSNCWICAGVNVLKGVSIADNIIIAANSTITKSLRNQYTIVASQGKILKENVYWKK